VERPLPLSVQASGMARIGLPVTSPAGCSAAMYDEPTT
jgi:hypothetical protein